MSKPKPKSLFLRSSLRKYLSNKFYRKLTAVVSVFLIAAIVSLTARAQIFEQMSRLLQYHNPTIESATINKTKHSAQTTDSLANILFGAPSSKNALAGRFFAPPVNDANNIFVDFESYTPGSVEGQDGWSCDGCTPNSPGYDHAVTSDNSIYPAPASFGTKSLRVSNAVVSGGFGDQTFSKSLTNEAGETSAVNDGQSGGTRKNHFETEFSIASAFPSAQQPNLKATVSPDRGDGARMSFLRFEDQADGIHVIFGDYQDLPPYGTANGDDSNGCDLGGDNFFYTDIATLDRSTAHTIKLVMDFVDGQRNDIVKVYVDGVLKHTGTSWEDYFRFCEGNPTRTVDSLLFRTGGTPPAAAAPGSNGFGFLFDNLTLSVSPDARDCNTLNPPYDVVTEFSLGANPNCEFTYGNTADSGADSAFTAYPFAMPNEPVAGIDRWYRDNPDADLVPAVFANRNGTTTNYFTIQHPADELNLHPGMSGERSVVRFTAPTAGNYQINGQFQGIDTGGTTTDVLILKRSAADLTTSTQIFSANVSGFNDMKPFALPFVTLAAGDVIDFSVGYGNGSYGSDSTGLKAVIELAETTRPTVTVAPASGTFTTSPIPFTFNFSEPVTGFDLSDIAVTNGTASNFQMTGATTYTADITPAPALMSASSGGTITVSVPENAAMDAAMNGNEASNIATINYDGTAPTVLSITRNSPSPTNATTVSFTVTFSENVTGVDAADFSVVTTGTTAGAFVSSVSPASGPASVYTVTVQAPANSNGTIRLDVIDNNSINDAAGNNLGGAGPFNGGFTGGEVYTIDTTAPTVTVNQATGQPDPTSISPVNFTAVFSEPVIGFTASDVTIGGTAFGAGSTPTAVVTTSDNQTFNIAISGMNQSGTVTATIAAGVATDAAGNQNTVLPSTDNTVTFNLVDTETDVNPTNTVGMPINPNLSGWFFYNESPSGGNGTGTFVPGPAPVPLGLGSVRLTVDSMGRYNIATRRFAGTRFADITELRYSTYQNNAGNPNAAVAAIALSFDVDDNVADGDTHYQGRLTYEPYQTPGNTVQQNAWQEWNTLNGRFWASPGANRPVAVACPQSMPCTRAQLLTLFPNLGVLNSGSPTNGYLLLRAGGPITGGFDGNADKLVIGINSSNTTFDFEPAPPFVSIDDAATPLAQNEGDSATTAYNFVVRLSEATHLPATVHVQTADGSATVADGDYTAVNTDLTFDPANDPNTDGDSDPLTQTVTVNVNGDTKFETDESFTLNLSNPVNTAITAGAGSRAATIVNDDAAPTVVSVAQTTPGTESGPTPATFTVTLSNLSSAPTTVYVSTTDGTATAGQDYTALTNQPVTIPANQLTTTFNVSVADDGIFEGTEDFTVNVAATSGGATAATATGTITDDETAPTIVSVAQTTPGAESGPTPATFTVAISGTSSTDTTVYVSTADGTATAGLDYTALSNQAVTVLAGQTTATFNVSVLDDGIFEGTEDFTVNVAATSGGTTVAATTGTITDNETQPIVSVVNTNAGAEPGTPNVFTVTLSGQTTQAVTVNYATSNGTATAGQDYTATSGTLNFAANASGAALTQTISVPTLDDSLFEDATPETFTLTLTSATNAGGTPTSATGSIADDDTTPPTLQFSSATYSSSDNAANTATITVTRTGATDNAVSVNYTTANGSATGGGSCAAGVDYISASGTLNFGAGVNSQQFTVSICPDANIEGNETVNLTLSNPTSPAVLGSPSTAVLTISDGATPVSISGVITLNGSGLNGVSVTLTGTNMGTVMTTTNASGNYAFNGLQSGGNYLVTPSLSGYAFEPINRSYLNLTTSVTNADFTAYPNGSIPRRLTIGSVTTAPGNAVNVPVTLRSLGNENGISFTLDYDETRVTPTNVACGADAPASCSVTYSVVTLSGGNAVLVVNLDLPNGTFFAASPPDRQALVISFSTTNTSSFTPSFVSPLTFTDNPTPREITNGQNPLPAEYVNGQISFRNLEADVAPRQTGDGFVTTGDSAQEARFVAFLEVPSILNNEFQRADCAPSGTGGDGFLTVGDSAQARRYAAGLDPLQPASGPTAPVLPRAVDLLLLSGKSNVFGTDKTDAVAANTNIKIVNVSTSANSTILVTIAVDAAGNENAFGFSLMYDAGKLSLPSANPDDDIIVGTGAVDSTNTPADLTPNTLTAGKIGVLLNFRANRTIVGGANRSLVTIRFKVASNVTTGELIPLTFTDDPITRQVVSTTIQTLSTDYANGTVTILGPTASTAEMKGYVRNNAGTIITGAVVTLTDSRGNVRSVESNIDGSYRITGIESGGLYVVNVAAQNYTFAPLPITINENLVRDLTVLPAQTNPLIRKGRSPIIRGF